MESLLLNINYLFKAAGYAVYDVLKLRVLMLFSQIFILVFAIIKVRTDSDIMPMIYWSVAFFGINGYQIVRLILERRDLTLEPLMEAVYQRDFAGFSRREFKSIWDYGEQRKLKQGERIIQQDTNPDYMYYLVEGNCDVIIDGQTVAQLHPGHFIGEMSYYSQQKTTADVDGCEDTVILAWNHEVLNTMQQQNPALRVKLQGVLCLDLISKLKQQSGDKYQ